MSGKKCSVWKALITEPNHRLRGKSDPSLMSKLKLHLRDPGSEAGVTTTEASRTSVIPDLIRPDACRGANMICPSYPGRR